MRTRRMVFRSVNSDAIVLLYGSVQRCGSYRGRKWQVGGFTAYQNEGGTYRGELRLAKPSAMIPTWLGVSNEIVYGYVNLNKLIRLLRAFPAPTQICSSSDHPDVRPWFHEDGEPGPYTEDPEDGYPYDE